MKLFFKAEKWSHPEWGKSELIWTKFFLADTKDIVLEILRQRYGKLRHYYSTDRCEEVIDVEEFKYEELTEGMTER